jgi:hypothetical protein
MSEPYILFRFLRIYFPRTWEFGSALTKLRNFGGGVGFNPRIPRFATGLHYSLYHIIHKLSYPIKTVALDIYLLSPTERGAL